MAVVVDVPCNSVEFYQLLCATRSLSRRRSGISIFVKVLHGKCGMEELDDPECEVAKFCVSWKL